MRHELGRFAMQACLVAPLAFGVLATGACSRPAQDSAAPAATAEPAGAPAATPGSPAGQAESARPARTAAPPTPVPPPPPRTFTLASGTVLTIRTNYMLSTDTQNAGERFTASLAEPLVSGDWVVAREGAEIEGLVVVSTKGGRVQGRAELEIAVTGLTLSDGQHVAVETQVDTTQAKSTKEKDAKTIAITAGIGTVVGAIAGGGKGAAIGAAAGGGGGTALVLGTRGKAAEIPPRSVLQFKVTRPVEIVEKK